LAKAWHPSALHSFKTCALSPPPRSPGRGPLPSATAAAAAASMLSAVLPPPTWLLGLPLMSPFSLRGRSVQACWHQHRPPALLSHRSSRDLGRAIFFFEITRGRTPPPPAPGHTQLSRVNPTALGRRQSLTDEGRLTHPISEGALCLEQQKCGTRLSFIITRVSGQVHCAYSCKSTLVQDKQDITRRPVT
jgi:hypothetical protein